jgi:hypothetical protein
MNIDVLRGTLDVSEKPGLDTIDPRFSDIAALVQGGKYEEAAKRSDEVLKEKIYDIRIIGYFLYGHFMERGLIGLTDIYLCLAELLSDNISALGPVRNREKHIQTILNWLVKQIMKTLQYEEERKKGLYNTWISGVSSDQVQEALDASDKLRRVLGPVLENAAGPVLDGMMKINDWLISFQRLVYREPEPEPEPKAEEEPEMEEIAEAKEEVAPAFQEEEREPFRKPAVQAEEKIAGVEGSYHLALLIKKLEAFDYLIAAQKYASAVIVADDIHAIIANFDPRIYFPKLFVGFSLLVAAHINNLTAYAEYKETPSWQALQDLYRTDLESFLDFDPDSIDIGASGSSGGYGGSDEYGGMSEDEEQ